MIWRPVVAGYGSLWEIKYQWTIDDLLDAHEALDIKEEAEYQAMLKARHK